MSFTTRPASREELEHETCVGMIQNRKRNTTLSIKIRRQTKTKTKINIHIAGRRKTEE